MQHIGKIPTKTLKILEQHFERGSIMARFSGASRRYKYEFRLIIITIKTNTWIYLTPAGRTCLMKTSYCKIYLSKVEKRNQKYLQKREE